MQKILLVLLSVAISLSSVHSQKTDGKLNFEQGKTYTISMDVRNTMAQQAMGQAIDFIIDGQIVHAYKVTNQTAENNTLHHTITRFNFNFDGMGQKRSFNSDNKKDMDGPFGKPVKDLLTKTYDIIIDSTGKTMMAIPEKVELSKADERLAIITNMLKDLTSAAFPPQKGESSFFSILPAGETGIGDQWTVNTQTATEKSITDYTLSGITDTSILVSFKTKSSSVTKTEIMGTEATTNLTSNTTGEYILDRTTRIIKQKTATIEASGNTEAMGTDMPVTVKTSIVLNVTKD